MQNINDVDGVLWGLSQNGEFVELETTIYKFVEKKVPINEELQSYKFNILTFKPTGEPETIEFVKAHIGDVKHFISNNAKAGYNGVMVKDGCIPKKTIKDIIKVTFLNFGLPQKSLKPILMQV